MASTAVCSDILTYLRGATAPATAAEIAEATGRGRSTVTAALRGLEDDGLTWRTRGDRDQGKRLPDLWSAATAGETDSTDAPAPAAREEEVAPQDAAPETAPATSNETQASTPATPADDSADTNKEVAPAATAAPHEASPDAPDLEDAVAPRPAEAAAPDSAEAGTSAGAAPARTTGAARGSDADKAGVRGVPVADGAQRNKVSGSARLEPGGLRLMVKAILNSDPDEEFSATEISHTLRGRSVGAIQNALARMVKDGDAELTCEAPRRYSAA